MWVFEKGCTGAQMKRFVRQCALTPAARLCFAPLFFFVFFSAYFLLPSFTSLDDQFFNIKFAELIRERGGEAFLHFNWFSAVGSYAWVANPLFYIALIPFTFFDSLELGIKFFAVLSLSLTFSVLYHFLSFVRVKFAFVSTLLILAILLPPLSLWHFLMARAFVILPAILLLILLFLFQKRYVAIGMLTFLYFFWHSATFFFPLVVALAYSAVLVLEKKAWDRWIILAPFSGIVAALLVAFLFLPGFSAGFLESFVTVLKIVTETGFSKQPAIQVGGEVYPINIFNLYAIAPILMALFFFFAVRDTAGYRLHFRSQHKLSSEYDTVWGTLFLLSLLFLLGSLLTKRMLDFFYIFASLFLVYRLRSYIDASLTKSAAGLAIAVVIGFGLLANFLLVGDRIAETKKHTSIRGAAEWLVQNSEEASIVFNPTINYFPTFFFFNQYHNRFVIGIEPRLLYEADQEKYWLWYHLSNYGNLCRQQTCDHDVLAGKNDEEKGAAVAEVLKNEFSAQFVIISGEFSPFVQLMDNSRAFQPVYTDPLDGYYSVYWVRSE
jgi:hypothetical protein